MLKVLENRETPIEGNAGDGLRLEMLERSWSVCG